MAVRVISTRLQVDGETEYKRAMESINGTLRTMKAELGYTESAFRGQANTLEALEEKQRIQKNLVDQQAEKIRSLEEAVKEASKAYGEHDTRTEKWRKTLFQAKKELNNMEDELRDTDKYLDEARSSTDKCAKSIDEFGREVKNAGGDLKDFDLKGLIGGLDNLKGMLVGGAAGAAIVAGLKEISGEIMELEESTREYRTIMGSLQVSSEAAGYTAEQTEEAFLRLYGVLGDTQTAATTVANLQAIGLSQKDLIQIIDGCTGAWSKYGDSIPIDGLAESINETIRSGEVTGTFADVLNWAGDDLQTFGVQLKEDTEANKAWNEAVQDATTSEDFFNLALSECETQSEKTQLMMDYLKTQGLIPLGEEWRNVNEEIIEANESEARLEAAWGKLGTALAPVADFLRNTLAAGIEIAADAAEGLVTWITKAIDKLKAPELKDTMLSGFNAGVSGVAVNGSHAAGLDFVPFDGYTAELHYGERVMTATENSALDTLSRAVSALEVAAHGAAPRTYETPAEAPQTVTIPVRVVLNGRIVGEETTTYQMQQRRATGT